MTETFEDRTRDEILLLIQQDKYVEIAETVKSIARKLNKEDTRMLLGFLSFGLIAPRVRQILMEYSKDE